MKCGENRVRVEESGEMWGEVKERCEGSEKMWRKV